jgi:nucleotide-binding universal stress UspA family protein
LTIAIPDPPLHALAMTETGSPDRIVVGVDGSDASLAALSWAVAEARLRGAEVEAIHAWTLPAYGYDIALAFTDISAELAAEGEAMLDRACAALEGGDQAVVRRVVTEAPPAAALLEAAEGATLLVVGSRGRGGFKGLLLGSVSQQCVSHAGCPVVVVH